MKNVEKIKFTRNLKLVSTSEIIQMSNELLNFVVIQALVCMLGIQHVKNTASTLGEFIDYSEYSL